MDWLLGMGDTTPALSASSPYWAECPLPKFASWGDMAGTSKSARMVRKMTRKPTSFVTVMTLMLASACTNSVTDGEGTSGSETPPSLAESSWVLAEISAGQAADAQSEAVEEGLYTLLFRADGSAAMRFDCNRGFGRWQVVEDGGAGQGSIAITDMGVTKALCPPTSISDRVIADFAAFDRFRIAGERLELKIEQTSVSYHWVRTDQEALIEGNE